MTIEDLMKEETFDGVRSVLQQYYEKEATRIDPEVWLRSAKDSIMEGARFAKQLKSMPEEFMEMLDLSGQIRLVMRMRLETCNLQALENVMKKVLAEMDEMRDLGEEE